MLSQKQLMEKQKHMPTLGTILMVEEVLKEGDLMKVAEIKRRLPRKVMHQTLLLILEYLQMSGKILIGTKGVLWTYNPSEKLELAIKKGKEM